MGSGRFALRLASTRQSTGSGHLDRALLVFSFSSKAAKVSILKLPLVKNICMILSLSSFVLVGCGPSESEIDVAYNAGWDSAYDEICLDIQPPMMMPSEFDDSKGRGELVEAYRMGVADAQRDRDLCE